MRSSYLTICCAAMFFSCGRGTEERVFNPAGKYSIVPLPGWEYQVKNKGMMISSERAHDNVIVTSSIIISWSSQEYPLAEMIKMSKSDYSHTLKNYQYLNQGITEISQRSAHWIRFNHTLYDHTYTSLRYFLEINDGYIVMIECATLNSIFRDYEEDFNKMVFSFKPEGTRGVSTALTDRRIYHYDSVDVKPSPLISMEELYRKWRSATVYLHRQCRTILKERYLFLLPLIVRVT